MPAPRSVVVAIRPTSLTSIGGCVVSHASRLGQQNKLASAAALGTARVEKERGTCEHGYQQDGEGARG